MSDDAISKLYRKKGLTQMRPYIPGENLINISVSPEDWNKGNVKEGAMIACNPKNTTDEWLISQSYVEENYEEAEDE